MTNEEIVLHLIKRILLVRITIVNCIQTLHSIYLLQTESGKLFINQYGIQTIISELHKIQECIDKNYHHLIEDIVCYVKDQLVPPLDCSRPLSYRSDASSAIGHNNPPTETFIQFNTSPPIRYELLQLFYHS